VLFAVLIAVASLLYTNHLVDQLREREQFVVELWTMARRETASATLIINPYLDEFQELDSLLRTFGVGQQRGEMNADLERYRRASQWAQSMPPPAGEITLATEILSRGGEDIPAIVIDSSGPTPQVAFWQNVRVPQDSAEARQVLLQRVAE